jgi:hypothetical protein
MKNLEQEIIEELSTQMQSEMDFHILSNMLVQSCGWTRVIISRFQDNHHAIDIRHWCENNIRHPYENRGTNFIFENEGDAINFSLRWA